MRIPPQLFSHTSQLAGLAAVLVLTSGCLSDDQVPPPGDPGAPGAPGTPGADGEPGAPGELDPTLDTWDKAMFGIGGQDALTGLTGLTIEASGIRRLNGESFRVNDPAIEVDHFDATTHLDLANDAMRVDWSRNALFFGGLPLSYSEIIDGDLGYVEGDDSAFGTAASTTDMPSARWAAVRKQAMLSNPHLLLAMVAAEPTMLMDEDVDLHNGVIHEVLVIADDVHPISVYVNATTGRIAKLSIVENDHLYRDIPIEVHFSDWMDDGAGGVAVPMSLYLTVNGQLWHEEYRTAVTRNPAFTDEFDFPVGANPMYDADAAMWGARSHQFIQGFNSLGITQQVEQLAVVADMLDTGIYFLGGSSHNSVVVEQATGVIVIEAPLYPERSQAILDWVQTNIGKPVSHLMITHHHYDHAAGFRPFVEAGATLIVHEASAELYTELARRPSTVVPDALAQNPRAADLLVVANGSLAFVNGSSPFADVAVVHVANSHAGDMLLAYVDVPGGTAYSFQSDLFSPDPATGGAALTPELAQQLRAWYDTYNVYDPDHMLIGGHGSYAPLSQLDEYVNPPTP